MRIAYFIGVAILALVIFTRPGEIASWFPRSVVTEQSPATRVTIHPNAVAKQPNLGVVVIPGAVICPNYDKVDLVISMYQEHWGETIQDRITQGQTVLLRGPAMPVPNLELLGCSLVPPGTPMQVTEGLAPSVTAQLPDGTIVRGITHPLMFSWDLKEQERQQTQKALAEQDRQKALDPQAWQNWQDKQRAFQEQQDEEKQDKAQENR